MKNLASEKSGQVFAGEPEGIVIQLNRFLKGKLASKKHSPLENKERSLFQRVIYREAITAIILAIPSAGSILLTYYGVSVPLSESGATLLQKGQALGFSITIGVFSWLTWFYLFGLVYRLSGKQLRNALIAGGIMVASMAAIDAPFNMQALAGSRAAQMSTVDVTRAYEARRSAIVERITVASRLAPALDAQTKRFEVLEQNEIKYGTSSGRKHPGKVSDAYGQVAILLGTLQKSLQHGVTELSAVRGRLTETLATMKEAAYRQGPIRKRMAEISYAADRADELLASLREHDFVDAIDTTLASLELSIVDSGENQTGFAKTQSDEVNAVAAKVAPVAATLRTALGDLTEDIAHPLPRPEDQMTAIFTYWRPLVTNWTAALFIGIAPAGLLVILIAGYRETEIAQAERRARRKATSRKEPIS